MLRSRSRKPYVCRMKLLKHESEYIFLYSVHLLYHKSFFCTYASCTCQYVPYLDSFIDHISSSTERQVFLATWKDIPNDNEAQFQIKDCHLISGNGGWEEKRECSPWKTPCPAAISCSFSVCENSLTEHRWSPFKSWLMRQIVFDENSSATVPIYVR